MLNLSPPSEYTAGQAFTSWLEELEDYILAAAGNDIANVRKRAILLSTIGSGAKKVIANMSTLNTTYYNLNFRSMSKDG